jgi:protein-L-isoaspartate O-methyltransferase
MITATYSPEDNKIRLTASERLDAETYARVKAAGYSWAPRQKIFIAPAWSPAREDIALELAGEIDDEDTSLIERAEDRSDRFEQYSENRTADAHRAHAAVEAIAGQIPLGQPILVGHHSERHARRDAEKIERGMRKAVNAFDTANYWTRRAAAAISAAKYKELPAVRSRRIKGIEAYKRTAERDLKHRKLLIRLWKSENLDRQKALAIANGDHTSRCFTLAEFPRDLPASQYEGEMGIWSALEGGVISVEQARHIALQSHERMIRYYERWISHYENRLAYERAMLQESGGTIADRTKPQKGGAVKCWVRRGQWLEIMKVNRVTVSVLDNWGNGGRDFLRTVKMDDITAILTPEQFAAFKRGEGEPAAGAQPEPAPALISPYIQPESSPFDAMRQQLAAGGVEVVSVRTLFPTPADVVARMIDYADIRPAHNVLEPSAGTGAILTKLEETGAFVQAVEINRQLVEMLQKMPSKPGRCHVKCADFLELKPSDAFDRVVMNPPFDHGIDIAHIEHALKMVKPGGRVVALCANGPRQRERFMAIAEHWEDLPAGTFAGTGVNAALMVLVR